MGEGEKSEPWRQVSSMKPRLQHRNTIEIEIKNQKHDKEEGGVHTKWSRIDVESFFLFSFFISRSDVVCYTLESDISIGPGSFAGSGQCVW